MADQMQQMQSPPEEETTQADTSNGYCIEIRVAGDGSMSIGVEPIAADDEANEEDYQKVSSIGEAIRVVKDIVANAGQIQDMGAAEGEMGAGYGKGA